MQPQAFIVRSVFKCLSDAEPDVRVVVAQHEGDARHTFWKETGDVRQILSVEPADLYVSEWASEHIPQPA